MNIIIFTIIKNINIKNIIFYVINIIRPHGDTWCLGSCLGAGHNPYTHARTWAPTSELGIPLRTRGLLFLCWAHPYTHMAIELSTWGLSTPSAHVALRHTKIQLSLGLSCCRTHNNHGSLAVQGSK
jgi:hypothetical protein